MTDKAEQQRLYRQTAGYRAAQKAYAKSANGQTVKKAYQAKPERRVKKRAYINQYNRTPRAKESARRYRQSEKGKAKSLRDSLSRYYGLTIPAVERMFADQSGLCAICMQEISLIVGTANYRHVDHDHAKQKGDCGFVRGLLCMGCNFGLGNFGDSRDKLRLALIYLEAHVQG